LASRFVYQNQWIRVREDAVLRPDGRRGIYGVVEMGPCVGVVALTSDGEVYLVGQYRYPTETYSWEIIAGGADAGEDLLAAARREMREETGVAAARLTSLGTCQISNGVTDQVGHLYVAEGLTAGAAMPDATEQLAVRVVPLAEAMAMVERDELNDAFSVVGLYRAWHRLHRGV